MRSVRRHDLDSVTVITKVHRPGQSAIWVDGEIWRVFRRHHPLGLQDWSRKSELFGFVRIPASIPESWARTSLRSFHPEALRAPGSRVSRIAFRLAEIIEFLIKADILENKEENERDSW